MRRIATGMSVAALAVGALLGAAGSASAQEVPGSGHHKVIPKEVCEETLGAVIPEDDSPTGWECKDGPYDDYPVSLGIETD
ncbi:hypothetical protein [Amycolatopsis anabasis]|uniref:hypothetical protein n=1 Tax=Amycolatopsis anabasis TaxID=1840409 RepID=UPI00131AA2B7|nr:hypothetical protein [Amycolatopsis anabasis]